MQVSGTTKLSLKPWPEYTEEHHVLLHSDSLLTVCEPSPAVRAAYLKKVGLTEEDFKPKEDDKVLLNEDEQLPQDTWADDYEPNYTET
jgi:hypothetical protein